jgi:hypothetical protein
MEKRYRFKRDFKRQFKAGDLVPEEFGSGMAEAMIRTGAVEIVPDDRADIDADDKKSITAPPADKRLRPEKVRTK